MRRRGGFLVRALLLLALAGFGAARAEASEALWQALRGGGHVLLMRHALAPGAGDPPAFRLEDCATQRNLSDEGRREARLWGERIRQRGVRVAEVRTSRWCRTRDTARLMAVGPVIEDPRLNSFFNENSEDRPRQTEALRGYLAGLPRNGPAVVLVSHQVNVTALTGVSLRSAEAVVLKLLPGGGIETVGRLSPD